jgi:hypothetical protein
MIGRYQNTLQEHIFANRKYDAPTVLNISILPSPPPPYQTHLYNIFIFKFFLFFLLY